MQVLEKMLNNLKLEDQEKYSFKLLNNGEVILYHEDKASCVTRTHDKNDMCHQLQALSLAKEVVKLDVDTLSEALNVYKMADSHYAYGSLNEKAEDVVKDKYFVGYELPIEVKIILIDYVKNSIEKVSRGVYEDGEGCSYNSISRKEFRIN